MSKEQIVVGALVVLLCLQGLWKHQWLLENTKNGQRLVRRFGPGRATTILRVLFAAGLLFGALLAANLIRPVRW